jgi:hypothetical protein
VTRSFSSLLTCGGLGPELDGCRSRSSTLYLICFEQRKVERGGEFACSTARQVTSWMEDGTDNVYWLVLLAKLFCFCFLQLGFDGGEMRSLA